ncbi:MAG: tripartite tricarboxylate transporter substrate binding protein [Betaproteobacteria bacterium]|nr:tripartite tricarboxylate transporter substrate binding protein [Betaproteobacteria bacterium]MBV9361733.1 tripartite tricarboxylate transporter substrate binding protein [Betaproteobacteria bacterium]
MRLLALLFVCAAAHAQTYPTKPVRIIVPVAAGGNQEITIRALADEMSKSLGQPLVIEARPSASALVGTQFVARSAPDGYTLLSVSTTFSRAAILVANAGYDPVKDFVGVTLVSRIPQVLEVNPGVPAHSVAELIALAKAKPGELSYATSGTGSTGHIAAELFMRQAGIKMLHVPYKGNAQSLTDVLGGQVNLMFDQVSTSLAHIHAGKLRPLGVTSRERSPLLPEVPTIAEQGLSGFEDVTWTALMAPTGTPPDIVERVRAAAASAVAQPELRKRFLDRAIELQASASSQEFTAYVKSEVENFARLAREANLKSE